MNERADCAPEGRGSQLDSQNWILKVGSQPPDLRRRICNIPPEGSKLSRLLEKYRLLSGEMNLLNFMDSGQDAGTPAGA